MQPPGRNFLMTSPLTVIAATALQPTLAANSPTPTPGAPPTFGTFPAVDPEVSPATFAEAEKLMQVSMSAEQRDMAALSWRTSMPAMRCGVTGLRPTFGRVARTGAMTLFWSLGKLGPMTRSVEDTMLVLQAIGGPDAGDVGSMPPHLDFDAGRSVKGLRLGYIPAWMQEEPATEVDRKALEQLRSLGMLPTPVQLPEWPYQSLNTILFPEGAAVFEDIMLDGRANQMKVQVPDAWPNMLRQARFLSAVDLAQADRMRRRVDIEMARIVSQVDVMLVPSLRDEMLTISNHMGHPSFTLRTGAVQISEARSDWAPDPAKPLPKFATPCTMPHGVTLIGRLFEEGLLASIGLALEKAADVVTGSPPDSPHERLVLCAAHRTGSLQHRRG